MLTKENLAYLLASAGLLILFCGYLFIQHYATVHEVFFPVENTDVHVHGDILIVVDGTPVDLTQDIYQSSLEQVLHPDIHLHDNEGDVLHRHAEGITFFAFLDSIGFNLTDQCVTLDTGEQKCIDASHTLRLFVNREPITDVASYILQEEDQVLLYYGAPSEETIDMHLDAISDRACIYSGTCPERGTPPPESCGLTCNI